MSNQFRWIVPVIWHPQWGETIELTVEGEPGEELYLVRRRAIEHAKAYGWTAPKWHEWWRWGEHIREDLCPEVPSRELRCSSHN